MLKPPLSFILFSIFLAFLCWMDTAQASTVTMTTYYPSPNGDYHNLYVSNNIGIGTTAPIGQLEVMDLIQFNNSTGGTFIGFHAAQHNTGDNNTALGYRALSSTTNAGIQNTAVGSRALIENTTGDRNTAVGYLAGPDVGSTNLSNTTAIGYMATATDSNQIVLGNNDILELTCNVTSITALSDGRFKSHITENIPGLAFISKLRPVTFHWNISKLNDFLKIPADQRDKEAEEAKDSIEESGFIAQEVEQAAKDVGYNFSGLSKPASDKDYYKLGYTTFVVPLVKAVQELNSILGAQQTEINSLKTSNNALSLEYQELLPAVDELKQQVQEINSRLDSLSR